ncbi:MAG: DUF3826 domain-containing protein [Niabella sp.]
MPLTSKVFIFFFFLGSAIAGAHAQSADSNYLRIVQPRAYKIVAALNINDSVKFYRVQDIIANEYAGIKEIDDKKENAVKNAKEKNSDKEMIAAEIKKITDASEADREALNKHFLQKLSKELDPAQIEQVKNSLTYNVFPITYKGYQEMLPQLTAGEKKYIYNALLEAREHAMTAGSSEAKHGWFGKYKGRINNYLSSHGYDMNKESKAWQERANAQKKENKK